jgi:hypothetical protein
LLRVHDFKSGIAQGVSVDHVRTGGIVFIGEPPPSPAPEKPEQARPRPGVSSGTRVNCQTMPRAKLK